MALPINAGPEELFMKRWIFICVGLVILSLAVWGISRVTGSKGAGQQKQQTKPKPLVVTEKVKLARSPALSN